MGLRPKPITSIRKITLVISLGQMGRSPNLLQVLE